MHLNVYQDNHLTFHYTHLTEQQCLINWGEEIEEGKLRWEKERKKIKINGQKDKQAQSLIE